MKVCAILQKIKLSNGYNVTIMKYFFKSDNGRLNRKGREGI